MVLGTRLTSSVFWVEIDGDEFLTLPVVSKENLQICKLPLQLKFPANEFYLIQ